LGVTYTYGTIVSRSLASDLAALPALRAMLWQETGPMTSSDDNVLAV
jgi:hypothetical protein